VQLDQEVWAEGREQVRQRLETRLAEVAAQQAAASPNVLRASAHPPPIMPVQLGPVPSRRSARSDTLCGGGRMPSG